MWVYIKSEASLWTVGFYDSNGSWHSAADHDTQQEAESHVHYLNGGD